MPGRLNSSAETAETRQLLLPGHNREVILHYCRALLQETRGNPGGSQVQVWRKPDYSAPEPHWLYASKRQIQGSLHHERPSRNEVRVALPNEMSIRPNRMLAHLTRRGSD